MTMPHPEIWPFLGIMFGLSLVAFVIAVGRGISLFESAAGFLLLIIIVWSPNIAAAIMTIDSGTFGEWWHQVAALPLGYDAWLLAMSPIPIIAATWLLKGLPASEELDSRSIALLIVINLLLGPLGEEFGLRGYLLPRLLEAMPFALATAVLGAIWAVWHLPLWFVDSPQAKIPFWVFCVTVLAFSVILGRVYQLGAGSVWPAVLFHFLVNVAVGWAEATGRFKENSSYKLLLPGYALTAAAVLAFMG